MAVKILGDGSRVKTNLVPRELWTYDELSPLMVERAKADGWSEDMKFFMFKDVLWCLDEFVRTEEDGHLRKAGWSGVAAQSAFHAVVVSLPTTPDDCVIVGQVLC